MKFRKPAGSARIEVSPVREEGLAVVSFRDESVGMSPDVLRRVFDHFCQAAPTTEVSGVGLSNCRMMVGEP